MAASSRLSRFVRIGMLVLIALASLPEVVCCCGLGYGIGGLLGGSVGGHVECRVGTAAGKTCACCAKKHRVPVEHDSLSTAQSSGCKFYLASQAPMADSRHVEVEHVPPAIVDLLVAPTIELTSARLHSSLTLDIAHYSAGALSRCARLQSWQV